MKGDAKKAPIIPVDRAAFDECLDIEKRVGVDRTGREVEDLDAPGLLNDEQASVVARRVGDVHRKVQITRDARCGERLDATTRDRAGRDSGHHHDWNR